MINILKNINSIFHFFLEVTLVITLIYFGWKNPTRFLAKLGLGVLLPLTLVIYWSIYMAPKSPNTLVGGMRILSEIVVFSMAIIAIYFNGGKSTAKGLAIYAFFNTVFTHIL